MIRSLLFSITAAGVALSAPLVTYVSAPREVVAKEESASAAELVSCFDYYRFGSVQVDMQPETPSTVTGVPLRFTGTISNQNEYPLVDGAVYVKVFKIDPTAEKNTAGPDVVAQFFVKKNIALAAKASAPLEFTWQVPGYAVSGDYRLASFFTAADKFNVLGLSFTDDVVGNMADFSIQGEQRGIVAFNKQAVTLNDSPYHFAAFPPQFERERDVTITAAVTNSTSQPHTIPVTWKLYAWDALREENVVAEANETVTVAAGGTATTTFIATDSAHPVYYAVGTVHYKDTTSTIGVRFVREAVQRTRINFPALTAFPLKANTEATVFSCLHGMGPDEAVPGGKLVLKVADRAGNPIHTTTYEGEVTGAMMGVRGTFVPTEDYHRLTVRAELYQDTNLVDEATMTYDCATLNPDQCPAEEAAPVAGPGQSTTSRGTLLGWLAILGILIVGGLTLFIRGRARSTSAALVLVIAGALGLLAPSEAAAASVSWSKTVDAQFGYRGTFTDRTGSLLSEWWILGLRTPTITVTYKARVINMETGALIKKGDTIPVFSDIRFEFEPHLFTDIHWFGTGFSLDSPYGDWIANAAAPTPVGPLIENIIPSGPLAGPTGQFRPTNQCLDKDYVGINNSGNPAYKPYIPLAVNPPLKTIAGLNNLVCQEPESNGSVVCAVVTPGRIAGHFEFKPTQGKFYYRYFDDNVDACFGTNEPMRFAPHGENAFIATELLGSNRTTTGGRDFTLDVPVQTIPFDFTAVGVAPNLLPPNTPIIEGPTTGVINETYGFTVKTTDPQNAQVQYGLDWTGDNVVDQWLPSATVFVPHNTPQPFSRLWTTVGQQTFRAKARNGHGLESGWATHTITLTEPAPSPTAAVWCSPATQTIQAGSTASFTHALQQAVSWRAPGGTPPSATNIAAFSTRYDAAGTYTASIVPPLFYDVTGDGSITIDDANAVFQNQGATTGPGNGSPWQNPANRFDVNADGFVTPLDGHAIGTYLNNTGAGPLPQLTCQVQVLPGEVTPTPTPTATPTPTPTATPTATPTPTTTPRTSGGPFLPGPVREDE